MNCSILLLILVSKRVIWKQRRRERIIWESKTAKERREIVYEIENQERERERERWWSKGYRERQREELTAMTSSCQNKKAFSKNRKHTKMFFKRETRHKRRLEMESQFGGIKSHFAKMLEFLGEGEVLTWDYSLHLADERLVMFGCDKTWAFGCKILYFTLSNRHELNKFTWFTNWFWLHRLLQTGD